MLFHLVQTAFQIRFGLCNLARIPRDTFEAFPEVHHLHEEGLILSLLITGGWPTEQAQIIFGSFERIGQRLIGGVERGGIVVTSLTVRCVVIGVNQSRSAVLSIITGGGKWIELTIFADPLYQHLLLTAEKKFWRCVESGEPPRLFGIEPPRPRIEAVRVVDMNASNSWADFAEIYCRTRSAVVEHEAAKTELKKLMPDDAKEATGHGIRAKRSKSGAISFELLNSEDGHAQLQ